MSDVSAGTLTPDQADPAHPEHQRWVKETLVADEVERVRKLPGGHNVTHDAIDRKIAEDVRRHYAREREGDFDKAPAPKREAKVADPAAAEAEASGMRLSRCEVADDTKPDIAKPPSMPCGFCGTCRACARTRRIIELVRTYKDSDGNVMAAYPGIAGQIVKLYWLHKAKLGPFREVASVRDRRRIFNRMIEDICDSSNAVVGVPWWV